MPHSSPPSSHRYVPLLEEYAYQPKTAALVESFDTCRDLPAEHPSLAHGATGVGPVDWPLEAPGLKTALGAFYRRADDVARDLFVAFAKACCIGGDGSVDDAAAAEVAAHFLARFGPTSHCAMRAMRYPGARDAEVRAKAGALAGVSEAVSGGSFDGGGEDGRVKAVGISEHTDFECFTLLHQTSPGLELKDAAGNWRTAAAYPDRALFTVIVADMMERWTNGMLRATPHRVALTAHERYSLVRFNGLDPDAVVAPLPRFTNVAGSHRGGGGDAVRYAATTQGEHMAASVTRAAKNLEDMLESKGTSKRRRTRLEGSGSAGGSTGLYPKLSLTAAPRHMAQLLVLRRGRVLLGRHVSGDFEGRWTGFIEEVKSGEDPFEAAVRALALGGMRLDVDAEVEATAASSDTKRRSGLLAAVRERARLRFTGWLDVPVIEHEFTCQLDGDELRTAGSDGTDGGETAATGLFRGPPGVTLVGAPTLEEDADRVPTVHLGGEADVERMTSGSGMEVNGEADEADGGSTVTMVPRWFDEKDIPYDEMPDDDRHWYPPALALAAKERTRDGSAEENVGRETMWETEREIIVGEFHFANDELARHDLRTILTDA